MSEIEALTKSLVQVIGSLQDVIAKKGVEIIPKQEVRIKKTPEMTYNEFLKIALSNRQAIEVRSKYSSYALQEDLQLLHCLSQYSQVSIKTFEQISKTRKINRSTQSLRSRYHDYLYLIEQREMKKIVSWIEKEGVRGYLVFENQEMKIQLNDPKESKKKEEKRPRSSTQEAGLKKLQKIKKASKSQADSSELQDILKLYSRMVNIPIQTLTDRLDQLSGDLSDLNKYIETKDARMLWTLEEDQILRRGGSQLDILIRYRGEKNVGARKKYLGYV